MRWLVTSGSGHPATPATNTAEPPAPRAADAGSALTPEECEKQGGHVVGDIGDGATSRPDYRCPGSGQPPIGRIKVEPGRPVPSKALSAAAERGQCATLSPGRRKPYRRMIARPGFERRTRRTIDDRGAAGRADGRNDHRGELAGAGQHVRVHRAVRRARRPDRERRSRAAPAAPWSPGSSSSTTTHRTVTSSRSGCAAGACNPRPWAMGWRRSTRCGTA